MDEFVADTHALYWYLTASPQLSKAARRSFAAARRGEARSLVPAIVLAELYYLNAKLGAPVDFATEFARLGAAPQIVFVPLDAEDVLGFDGLQSVPEMHDRII